VLIIKLPRIIILSGRRGKWRSLLIQILLPFFVPVAVLKIRRAIKNNGAEIVHTNGIKFHLLASPVRLLARFKLVWHFRDLPQEKLWSSIILLFARFFPHKIIVNSDAVARFFDGCCKHKTITIFNGIDFEKFKPVKDATEVRKSLGFSNEFIVGMFSMFTEWKGHNVLVDAAYGLKDKIPDIRFIIAGDALYDTLRNKGIKEKIIQMTEQKKLNGILKFTGYREDVQDLMNAVDVVVNPTTRPEPFGRVIAEAMALSKPVIITEDGGLCNIVKQYELGIVIPRNDDRALRDAIIDLYQDKMKRISMGKKAREVAEMYFSIHKYIHGIQNVYEELKS